MKNGKNVTVDDIRNFCGLGGLPSRMDMNAGVVLDFKLANALESDDFTFRNKRYDFDVYLPTYGINLQRPYVWEDCQKVELIKNIILEKPIDEVVIVEHEQEDGIRVKEVIDGKQRLMTIHKFLHNEFSITVDGHPVFYRDFSEDLKIFFRSRVNSFVGRVYYSDFQDPMPDKVKVLIFNYYNFSGTPQTEAHKNRLMGIISKG